MKTTKNLGLKKPEATDFYNVEDFNENMDTIDEEMQKLSAESMASLPDIPTTTTILDTVKNYYANGIKSGRFFSPDNVADNPEKNWSFSIEFFDCGRSLVLVKAYKTHMSKAYYRQLNIETGEYLYEWVCDYNTGNKPSFSDVEAITYGTHRVQIQEGDNLNDYINVGGYACINNDASSTLLNSPIQVSFTLDVLSGTGLNDKVETNVYSYIIQHIRSIEGEEYFRRVYSNPETDAIIFADWQKVIHSGFVANNLVTTEEGYVLDARQGKALKDMIPEFKSYSVAIPADTSYNTSVTVDWAPNEAFIVGASVTADGVAYDALTAGYAKITRENYIIKIGLGSDAFMKGKTLNITLMKIPSQD